MVAILQSRWVARPAATLPPLQVTTSSLPSTSVGQSYSASVSAVGGLPPYTWGFLSVVPDTGNWLSMTSGGQLSGTPQSPEIESVLVQVIDANGTKASAPLSIVVGGNPLVIVTSSPLSSATVGNPYSVTVVAQGGVPPYTWSLQSASPNTGSWLSVSTSGLLSGTPNTAESESLTVKVQDSVGTVVTKAFTLAVAAPAGLSFPRVALVGNGGDQSYGSNASTGFPAWTTAAAGSAARTAIQTIGAFDLAILAGIFEGWDTNGARDRENLAQALNKTGLSYTVPKNTSRPTLSFFYHIMSEGNPSGSGTGYDQLIAQINAMNGWMYESAGGTGTKTPSAFAGATLINYSTAWPGGVGSALIGQSIVGANYGSLSTGSPTGQQGVARTNGNYAAEKLLIRGTSGDTRFTFNAQMAAPSCAGVMLDNCFVALDGAGTVANSSLDGINIFPGAQQGGGFPALDTVQPLLARGIHNFFDQLQTMATTYGTPGKTYYNFGNIGQYANKYQFGTATLTCGLENTMHGGLLEDVMGAGAPSWEYQQTGKAGGGNWLSGAVNVLANYYQAMDFCQAPKLVVFGIRLPSSSTASSWVNGGGSTLTSVTFGSALEYQEMRCGLCTALMDDGYFGVGTSGYDWAGPRWYDEFGDDSLTQVNVKRGYMGAPVTTRPTVAAYAQGPMGVWQRDFTGTNGIGVRVLWNPRGNGAQTVALGGTFKALTGTQQPTINNGASVNSVSLADGDGRILLGPFPALQITTTTPLPSANVGAAYSATMAATGGVAPYIWAITADTPNTGNWLSISSGGVLSGTPGTAETESVTIRATDSIGNVTSGVFSLTVSPAQSSGFTPLAGMTVTGTFADGQSITISRPAGGFGTKPGGALPLYYFPLDTDFKTHATLCRNPGISLNPDATSVIQTSIKPVNATAAAKTSAQDSAVRSPAAIVWLNPMITSGVTGQMYCFRKTYFDHIWDWGNGATGDNYLVNVKLLRGWTSGTVGPDMIFGGDASTYVESIGTSAFYDAQPDAARVGQGINVWHTHEYIYTEGTLNTQDGVRQFIVDGLCCYSNINTRFTNNNSTYNSRKTDWFLSEYSNLGSNNVPGHPDPIGNDYNHCIYFDDSFCRVMVSNETTYSTTSALREICICTAWSDTSITFVLRKGAFASLSGLSLQVYTGPYNPIKVGTFT